MDHIRLVVSCDDPIVVAAEITRATNLEFEPRESTFWGPYWIDLAKGSLRVFLNRDPLFNSTTDPPEDKWFQAQFPDHAVLVDVDDESLCAQVSNILLTAFPGSQIVDE